MRIVSVIDGLGYGGAERSLAEMLPGLVDAGVEPTVVCLSRRDGGVEPDVLARGFDVRFLPAGRARRLRVLRHIIGSVRAEVVHTALAEASFVGRVATRGTGIPVLSSLVNQSYTLARRDDPHVHRLGLTAVRAVDRFTARHMTDHFHAITHAVARSAVETLSIPPGRITVVERGRDHRRLGDPGGERRARIRSVLRIPEDARVLVTVGRQEFQKGHRSLIAALPRIVAAHPTAVLLIAGRDGSETPLLADMARRSAVGDHIRFLGHRDDLPDVLAGSDVFVFPSLWEGLGGAVIEAMALGLPIVASDLEPLREVTESGRGADLVPAGDPIALAEAVTSLLADRSRARSLGTAGRAIYFARFTLDRSVEGMVALYRRVARGEPAVPEEAEAR